MKKIEFALHNALPTLVIVRREDGWHAYIEYDWADSYEGNFWPGDELAEGGVLSDGSYADWTKAEGAAGVLGAIACSMDFPKRYELGKLPERFVAHAYESYLAYENEADAQRYAEPIGNAPRGTVEHVNPDTITDDELLAACRASVGVQA